MIASDFPDRSQQLLKVLVERYIREGHPVGSKALVEESGLAVSSATARNIMADLEERGYLRSPHTSSGRVPTDLAYRLFVDNLATYRSLRKDEVSQIAKELNQDKPTQDLVSTASSLIAETTQLAGVVLLPRHNEIRLRRIEFLPLSGKRILVVMVVNEHEVQNRIFRCEEDYDEEQLKRVTNYLNQHVSGESLERIRSKLNALLLQEEESLRDLVQSSIDLTGKAFDDLDMPGDFVIAGESNLLQIARDSELDSLQAVFDALEEKRGVLGLLDQCIAADETCIFIGAESGYSAFYDCSIVAAPYSDAENVLGVLAVVGPMRMDYQRIVPSVDLTAKILSTALNQLS